MLSIFNSSGHNFITIPRIIIIIYLYRSRYLPFKGVGKMAINKDSGQQKSSFAYLLAIKDAEQIVVDMDNVATMMGRIRDLIDSLFGDKGRVTMDAFLDRPLVKEIVSCG
jgi:hypothetical protein